MRKLLLRKAALKAKPFYIPADNRSPIHLQDRPSSGLYATGIISQITKCLGGHVTFELTPDSEKPPAPKPKPWWDIDDTPLAPIFSLTVLGLIGWGVFSVGSCGYHAVTREKLEAPVQIAQAVPEPASVRDEGYSDTIVIAGAKSAVLRKLVDDRSARFREVGVVVQASGTKAVCGEVNSKNRAGGYSGYQHFISAGTDDYTYLEEQVPNFSEAWDQLCVR